MKILKTDNFKKSVSGLVFNVRRLFGVQEKRFIEDHKDPRLHIKKLKDLDGVFSFRITQKYRVLFYFQNNNVVVFFEIGHRKDIYK